MENTGLNASELFNKITETNSVADLEQLMKTELKSEEAIEPKSEKEEVDLSIPTDEPTKEALNKDTPPATPEEKQTETKEAPEPKQDAEWMASLAPEVQERVAALQKNLDEERKQREHFFHQSKSDAGRQAALQRKIKELEAKLETQLKVTSPSKPKDSASDPNEEDEDFKALKEIDPVFAEIMKRREQKILEQARKDLASQIDSRVSPLSEAQHEAFLASEREKLLETIPDAFQVAETKEFKEWMGMQSPSTRALVESDYADDIIKAFVLYTVDMHRMYGPPANANPPATPQAPVATPDPQAAKLEEERKRKASAATPPSAQPAVKPSAPGASDPEALFRHYYNNI